MTPTRPRRHQTLVRQTLGKPEPTRSVADRAYNAERRAPGTLTALVERLRSGGRWQRLRRLELAKRPLCVLCEARGLTTPAVDVDHVIPALIVVERHGEQAFYDQENLQPVCRACHVAKTAREGRP